MRVWSELRKVAKAATKGPWHWRIHDHSTASLTGVNEDEEHVISTSPCKGCLKNLSEPKEWKFGRCLTPNDADARFMEDADPAAVLELLSDLSASLELLREYRNHHATGDEECDDNRYGLNSRCDLCKKADQLLGVEEIPK